MKIVAQFEIPYYQILNEQSELVDQLPENAKNVSFLIHLYRLMVFNRVFDSKAIALQRTGQLGTYPSTRGQEAVFVGMGAALAPQDIYVPYYRDIGVFIAHQVSLVKTLLYWGGDERGNDFASSDHFFPYSVPVGSQGLHAAGVATAIKIKQEKKAVLTVCGEGGTSEGDFYEAMNVAGVWQLPVVFVVSNNQWAISVSREQQTAAKTIAQKAIAAGFQGEQVDGNDVLAVYQRTQAALKKARDQHAPTLIEMICYRQSDHTTADDAKRYEPAGVRETEWAKEPIQRLKHYLQKAHGWTDQEVQALHQSCETEVDQIVADYLKIPPQSPEAMFDYLYALLPKVYSDQRQSAIERGKHG